MEGAYEVTLGTKPMGTVKVNKLGLYWQVDCCCSLAGEVMYDLIVSTEAGRVKLGLLMPQGDTFCLKTKLSVKQLGQGRPTFSLQPRHAQMQGHFVAVKPEEPFAYLRQLENAYLARHNGEIGLVLQEEKI